MRDGGIFMANSGKAATSEGRTVVRLPLPPPGGCRLKGTILFAPGGTTGVGKPGGTTGAGTFGGIN